MAVTKKKAKKKVKDGIHLERSKSGKTKGQFNWNVTNNGRILCDSGETYKNRKDALKAMERVHLVLADYFVMNNEEVFFDETGDVK